MVYGCWVTVTSTLPLFTHFHLYRAHDRFLLVSTQCCYVNIVFSLSPLWNHILLSISSNAPNWDHSIYWCALPHTSFCSPTFVEFLEVPFNLVALWNCHFQSWEMRWLVLCQCHRRGGASTETMLPEDQAVCKTTGHFLISDWWRRLRSLWEYHPWAGDTGF